MFPRRYLPLPRAFALLPALLLTAVLPTNAQPPTERKPVPDAAVQGQAEITITRLYASQFKAAKSDKTAAHDLARELLTQGKATRDDYHLRFMALKLAGEQAAVAGDFSLTLEAIGELASSFQMDTIDLKAAVYGQMEKTLIDKTQAVALTQTVLNLVDEALVSDNFAVAARLLDIAKKAMLKSQKVAMVAQVEKRGKDILEAQQAFKAIQPFLAKVGQDDKATLAVGKYYCFIKGNYAKGLPLLAKGNDKRLKAPAERDLAEPKDAYAQTLLADAWNELARGEKGLVQRQILRRASHWYQTALPKLAGLTRVRVQREVEDLGQPAPIASVTRPPAQLVEITAEVRAIAGVPHPSIYASLAVSKDGKWILSGGSLGDTTTTSLWDAETGQKVKDLVGQNNDEKIYSVAISPDKKYALTAGGYTQNKEDGFIRLWDLQTGKPVRQFAGHKDKVVGGYFLPDGKRVISACEKGSIRIFDLNKGDLLKILNGPQGRIYGMAISQDGRRAVSGGSRKVIIWDLQTGQQLHQFEHQALVRAVAVSQDGKWAVATGTKTVTIWDVNAGKELRTLQNDSSTVRAALSPDGQRVYIVPFLNKQGGFGNRNNPIQVFDPHTGQELRQLTGHAGTVHYLAVSPDGRWLVSLGGDGIRIWGAK